MAKQKPSSATPLLVLTATIVALGAGLVWFSQTTPRPAPVANALAARSAAPTVSSKTVAEKNPTTEIDAQYPQVDGLDDAQQTAQLNGELENAAMSIIADFKKNEAETSAPDPLGSRNTLTLTYDVTLLTPEVLSMRYDVSTYSAGAAHPNAYYKTVNWDIVHAAEIDQNDLFRVGADWITRFSELSIEKLTAGFSESGIDPSDLEIKNGAGPKIENFSAWTMDRNGITLWFAPYQVAAYAAGPQHVFMTWSELNDMLVDDSILSPLIQK